MLARYGLSAILAVLMTFVLFAIMIALIKTGQHPVAGEVNLNLVDFIRDKRDRNLNLEDVKPEPPPLPAAPPPPARLQMENVATAPISAHIDPGLDSLTPDSFSITPGFIGAEGGGDYLPIAQVAPQYPRDALYKGIEGWVLVEFTIGTEGQVRNPRIVQSEPAGVFDAAALGAVKRFRFKPRMIGTSAVEVSGVQNRIKFRLQPK